MKLNVIECDCCQCGECDNDIIVKTLKDKICSCGHRSHGNWCLRDACCSLIKCPVCADPEPAWLLDCHEGFCPNCAITIYLQGDH